MKYIVVKIPQDGRTSWGVISVNGSKVKRESICADEDTALLLAAALAGGVEVKRT